MSRSLDIAKMLRATELDNTDNNRLLHDGEEVRGVDSATVQSTGMQYYSTLDSLPTTNLEVGLLSFVEENRRLYLSDGNGWYNTAYVASALPYWVTEPDSTYEITDSATPLIITALANDSDNPLLVNQSFGSDSQEFMATVSNDSSVFTFTPKSADSISQSVIAGDLTDSNGDFVYTFKWSDGINFVAKEVTITYNTRSSASFYGGRALIIGGNNRETTMDYYNITTTGNATDFGDTVENTIHSTAISDGSRAVYTTANTVNKYETVSISTTGNSTTFGNLYRNGHSQNSCTDGSRGVFAGGSGPVDTMEYITIGTTGTASDWGYVLSQGRGYGGGTSDGTKGFYFGGLLSGTPRSSNVIDYITIQVPSDATDFGDLSQGLQIRGATADATRAVVGGGMTITNDVYSNEIQYITMASAGNAVDFGDLTRNAGASCTGDGTYATWNGGVQGTGTPTYYTNVIDYVTIQTTGNATDFGDLSVSGNGFAATSGNAA